MQLVVNGETLDYQGDARLVSLLEHVGADSDRVATMLNNKIVRKEDRPLTTLKQGDHVEVLVFAGGGC